MTRKRILVVPIILALATPYVADAKARHISYRDADCNMTAYLLMNAQERLKEVPSVIENDVAEVQENPVNEEELELLAHLVYAETGNLGKQAMMYTGSVVLNRVAYNRYYPNTIKEVIFQRGQYACTWDGHFEWTPSQDAYDVAYELLKNGSVLPSGVVFQSEFRQGDFVYAIMGNTYYCGLKE